MEEQNQQVNPNQEQSPEEKPKSKKGLIITIVVLAIVVIGGVMAGYYYFMPSPDTETLTPLAPNGVTPPAEEPIIEPVEGSNECEQLYNEIEKDLDDANYCEVDADCDVMMLGGIYIEFGCGHYVNKNTDKQQIYDKMQVYESKCDDIINDCGEAITASCVAGKCVESLDTSNWQTYRNEEFGFKIDYPSYLSLDDDHKITEKTTLGTVI